MKRFDSSKWIIENKYGKLSEYRPPMERGPEGEPLDRDEEDPRNMMRQYHEIEKDPDAQVAEPKVQKAPENGQVKAPENGEDKKPYPGDDAMKGGDFKDFYPERMQGALGTSRKDMPQVPADDFEKDLESEPPKGLETNEPEKIPDMGKATIAYLNSSNDMGPWPKGDQVNVSEKPNIDVSSLKATQLDIYMDNALKKVASAEGGSWFPWTDGILASNDSPPYILDGHHRWAATIVYNHKHGTNHKMTINQIEMPIKDLLKVANAYTDAHPKGQRQAGGGTATENQDPRHSLYERLERHINK